MRCGYGRIDVTVRREGWPVNAKRNYGLQNELGLQLCNKSAKQRVKAKRLDDPKDEPTVNETRAMDFAHDEHMTGFKLRILTVVDAFNSFSPVVDPRFNYKEEDVSQMHSCITHQISFCRLFVISLVFWLSYCEGLKAFWNVNYTFATPQHDTQALQLADRVADPPDPVSRASGSG